MNWYRLLRNKINNLKDNWKMQILASLAASVAIGTSLTAKVSATASLGDATQVKAIIKE